MSIRNQSAQLDIPRESTGCIIRLNLGLYPYRDSRQSSSHMKLISGWSHYVIRQNCHYWRNHGKHYQALFLPKWGRINLCIPMLTGFLWPKLENFDISEIWFQQSEAACYTNTSYTSIDLLKDKFDSIIAWKGFVNWPPRSWDLITLWGSVKFSVYASNPATLDQLETNIAGITPQTLALVIKNWAKASSGCLIISCTPKLQVRGWQREI